MPKARTFIPVAPILWLSGALMLLVLIWALWSQRDEWQSAGEEFRSFRNLTSFPDTDVWDAYRFALANPGGILNYVPCFCGCLYHGDTSNRDCYIDGHDSQGRPIWDPHASG